MKRKKALRLFSAMLAGTMVLNAALPALAETTDDTQEPEPAVSFEQVDDDAVKTEPEMNSLVEPEAEMLSMEADETVRVSIILDDEATIGKYDTDDIANNKKAMNYRAKLEKEQQKTEEKISDEVLNPGEDLDVVWNLTLAANLISANVQYSQIDAIKEIDGVKDVVIENRYEPAVVNQTEAADPNMATSNEMIGSSIAYADDYTGAGSRIAVIDTGLDTDHQSFDAGAFEYALEQDGYTGDLLDAKEISGILGKLNVSQRNQNVTADDLYVDSKIAFGYNYVDGTLTIDHDHDSQGEHGSHVAGIATANAYIPDGNGGYESALDAVKVQGVAPDAQILVMKVFGSNGGAYDSDYMAAIEDAVLLDADAINLSLGSSSPGYSESSAEYQEILDNLVGCGAVVVISAGNSYSWQEYTQPGALYQDDINMQTAGSPGTYTNSLAVASVDNDGFTGGYLAVDGQMIGYNESSGFSNEPFMNLAGTWDYVYIEGTATEEELDELGDALAGKILVCSRGAIAFSQKANNAVDYGAIGTVIYNNQGGTISMDLSDYKYTEPCVSITQKDGETLKNAAERVEDEDTGAVYYEGTMEVSGTVGASAYHSAYYTMSDFSSWGIPGDLSMKPEITAPGGSIYSVNGAVAGGKAYETMSGTSMAAPQVTGMAALAAQYIKEQGLDKKTGVSVRTLAQSLLMSTAEPLVEAQSGNYYSVLKQGAGLANIGNVVEAGSYITMGQDATDSWKDGKVKVELGEDEAKSGSYQFCFTLHNLTDEEAGYTLSSELFTQAVSDGTLSTMTTPLADSVTWSADGKTLKNGGVSADFNGDGKTDDNDVTALLEYVAGARESLSDQDKADVNGDGKITSYDAYLFLQNIGTTVTVPAGGETTITVRMTLTDGQKALLDENYANGAYIEGYVFAKPLATADGEQKAAHSIPILGFYGDWSAASMYDRGSHMAYESGEETAAPYLGDTDANYVAVTYAKDPGNLYYFGGNPFFEEEYKPERNALNTENGDSFYRVGYSLIRNAAGGRLAVLADADPENPVYEQSIGETGAAFYYVNKSTWMNTTQTERVNWTPDDSMEEDASYRLVLSMATEYDYKGEDTDWNGLGEGASLSIPFTVDNTAPEIEQISLDAENQTLSADVKDNQYVAAVALISADGEQYLSMYHPEQENAGEEVSVSVDLSEQDGSVYLMRVYDYAMNQTTYRVTVGNVTDEVEEVKVVPEVLTLAPGNTAELQAVVTPENVSDATVLWTSSDEKVATVTEDGVVTALAEGSCILTATSKLDPTKYAECELTVSPITAQLNGVVPGDGQTKMVTFDAGNLADVTETATIDGVELTAFSYDSLGTMYGAAADYESGTTDFYRIGADHKAELITSGVGVVYADLAESPILDSYANNCMLAVYGPYILIVSKDTGDYLGYFELYQNNLVAIAYAGSIYSTRSNSWADCYLLVDASGNIYRQAFVVSQGSYSYAVASDNSYVGTISGARNTSVFDNAAYYDGKRLFWSAYDGEKDRSVLYVYDMLSGNSQKASVSEEGTRILGLNQVSAADEADTALFNDSILGAPAAMTEGVIGGAQTEKQEEVTTEETGTEEPVAEEAAEAVEEAAVENPEAALPEEVSATEEAEKSAAGSLNAVVTTNSAAQAGDEDTVTLKVTALDADGRETASHNGKVTVSYDSSALTLENVIGYGYYGKNTEDGTVTVAYADTTAFAAGNPVAVLQFTKKADAVPEEFVITHEELNAAGSGYVETVSVTEEVKCAHASMQHVEEVKADCENDGNIEYWYCPDCDRYFADANGTEEIGKEDVSVAALGHNPVVRNAKAAANGQDGYTGDTYCSRCGKILEKGQVIPGGDQSELNDALNAEGSSLKFVSNGTYYWKVEEDDEEGRTYAVSTNEGVRPSVSSVSTTVELKKGQAISFDWKTSAAPYVDDTDFTVNGISMMTCYTDDDAYNAYCDGEPIEWKNAVYPFMKDGVYTFTWNYNKDEDEDAWDDCDDKGYLDEVQIIDVPLYDITFKTEGDGTFADGSTSITMSMPGKYKLSFTDIPAVAAGENAEFLCWTEGESDGDVYDAVEPAGNKISGNVTYVAHFVEKEAGDATIILESHNVQPDGVGYQMLLDADATAYEKYFNSMNIITNTHYEDWADYMIPGAAGNETFVPQVVDGEVAINVPEGIYDWAIIYPRHDTDTYLLTAMDLDYPSYRNDDLFIGGYTYRYLVYANADGRHDSVKLQITKGNRKVVEPEKCTVSFVAGEHGTLNDGDVSYEAYATCSYPADILPAVTADEGYYFTGWDPEYKIGTPVEGDTVFTAQFEKIEGYAIVELEVASDVIDSYIEGLKNMGYSEDMAKAAIGTPKYGMFLDSSANAIGTVTQGGDYWKGFPMNLSDYGKPLSEEFMKAFSATLPEGFDGSLDAEGFAAAGETITTKISEGVYDYIIAEQSGAAGAEIFQSASNYGEQEGYAQDFTFEKGKVYHFTVSVEAVKTSMAGVYPVPLVTLTVTDCDHRDAEHVDAKDATEKEEGNIEYWYCPDCGKYFKDAELTEEISYEETVIPAKGSAETPEEPKDPENPKDPETPSTPENPKDPTTPSTPQNPQTPSGSNDSGNSGAGAGTTDQGSSSAENASQVNASDTSVKTSDSMTAEIALILLLIGCACSAAAYRRRRR